MGRRGRRRHLVVRLRYDFRLIAFGISISNLLPRRRLLGGRARAMHKEEKRYPTMAKDLD